MLNSPNADRFGSLIVGDQRRPPQNSLVEKFHTIDVLPEFIEFVDQIQSHQSVDRKTLAQFQTALGGARPKLTLRQDNDLYIAKPCDNAIDIPSIESICLNFAKSKGLNVCETSIAKIEINGKLRNVLLLKRFDRIFDEAKQKFKRIPTLSALSLLNASWLPRDAKRWSYPLLAQSMVQYNMPVQDLHELYTRMLFNALLGNDDDHPKNHAFYYMDRQWRLAPLYDVVPNLEFCPTRLAMKVGIQGKIIQRENLLSMCEAFQLTRMEATEILEKVFAWKTELQAIFAEELNASDYKVVLGAMS